MSEQQNIKIVQDAYAAFGRSDIAGILNLATNDIDWQMYGPAELPMSGPRRGKPDVQKFFDQVGATWSFATFEPKEFIAQGNNVVVLGQYTGTAKNTNRKFDAQFSHVFTITGDKVSKFREYTDTANLLTACNPSMSRV